ncbi:MAG TPA: nicotinate phosphoribosyltransferase [Candidatus Xenobia bacterium]
MNLSLLTDFYQLTMLGAYVGSHKTEQRAVFDLYFRKVPQNGGYCIVAGLEQAMDYVANLRFSADDIDWLCSQGHFPATVREYLKDFRFTGDIHGVPEGTVVFPQEPLLRVEAPIAQAQVLESTLLNIVNFQTLVATKASRVCMAAAKGSVLEFGLRRAQGVDGALSASRASYIGGCAATSNSLAGKAYGIPVRGTQAHSWIMSFASELEAFRTYAQLYPDQCLLLVDTYDTLQSGLPNAITVARELAAQGHRLTGIRLDSGDLAYLSKQARRMLDEAGFADAIIVASNDLDEWIIYDLQAQGARIDSWGVGTSLVTSKGASALGGVYKLVAAQDGHRMEPRIKVSGNPDKITNPGIKQIWRVWDGNGIMLADALALTDEAFVAGGPVETRHPTYFHQRLRLDSVARVEPLLLPIMQGGRVVYRFPALSDIQARARQNLQQLPEEYKRFVNPHIYWVGLTPRLFDTRAELLSAHSGALTL